ncbi:MAG: methylenetetrahydrofolate reductase [NAD(P)H] [Elusimicrobiota bacterium]
MKVSQIYNKKDIVFSCEVFPPKPGKSIDTVYSTISDLREIAPDFVSVTYGAGGGTKKRTLEISSKIKNEYNVESLMHLTCVTTKKEEIHHIINDIKKNNIENILALRGDYPEKTDKIDVSSDFCYAVDLVEFIKKHGNFCIGVAGYPETHPEAESRDKDIIHLKEKVDAGADFIITQLFFDNNLYYRFIDDITAKGIEIPVSAGIMPVFKAKLVKKMVSLCGASIPGDLQKLIDKYKHNPEDMRKAGIDYALNQINDLIRNDIRGIHLYTMNKSDIAEEISYKTGLR